MIEIKKKEKFSSREEAAATYRQRMIVRPTRYEQIFFKMLHQLGYQFEFQKIIYTKNSFYIVDFYINDANVIIELDGQGHKERMQEDANRTKDLKDLGYTRVVRFWNKEILKRNYCKSILKTIIWKRKESLTKKK